MADSKGIEVVELLQRNEIKTKPFLLGAFLATARRTCESCGTRKG
jgi:hypothetical protein